MGAVNRSRILAWKNQAAKRHPLPMVGAVFLL